MTPGCVLKPPLIGLGALAIALVVRNLVLKHIVVPEGGDVTGPLEPASRSSSRRASSRRSSSPPSAVATFVDQYLARHEIRKWIIRRFRAEGIEIPFSIRTIELKTSRGKVAGP